MAELIANSSKPGQVEAIGTLVAELKPKAGTKASFTQGTGTSTWRVVAKNVGNGGNGIAIVVGINLEEEPTEEYIVSVEGRTITVAVNIFTGVPQATAEGIIKAINASGAAHGLVNADNGTEGKETGAGKIALQAKTFLAGGDITCESEAAVPSALNKTGTWRMLLDEELVLVYEVSGSGKVLHINAENSGKRSIEGTAEATHLPGIALFNPITTGMLIQVISERRPMLVATGDFGIDNSGATNVGKTLTEATKEALITKGTSLWIPDGTYLLNETYDFTKVLANNSNVPLEVRCSAGAKFVGGAGLGKNPLVKLRATEGVVNQLKVIFAHMEAAAASEATACLLLGAIADSTMIDCGILLGGEYPLRIEPGAAFCANNFIRCAVANEGKKGNVLIKSGVTLSNGFQTNTLEVNQIALAPEGGAAGFIVEGVGSAFNYFILGPVEQNKVGGIKEAAGADYNHFLSKYTGVSNVNTDFIAEGGGHSTARGYFEDGVKLTGPFRLLNIAVAPGPVAIPATIKGELTNTSKAVKAVSSFTGLLVGMEVSRAGIPASTTIATIERKLGVFQMSAAATESGGALTITVAIPNGKPMTNTYEVPLQFTIVGGEKVKVVVGGEELGEGSCSPTVMPGETIELKWTVKPTVTMKAVGN